MELCSDGLACDDRLCPARRGRPLFILAIGGLLKQYGGPTTALVAALTQDPVMESVDVAGAVPLEEETDGQLHVWDFQRPDPEAICLVNDTVSLDWGSLTCPVELPPKVERAAFFKVLEDALNAENFWPEAFQAVAAAGSVALLHFTRADPSIRWGAAGGYSGPKERLPPGFDSATGKLWGGNWGGALGGTQQALAPEEQLALPEGLAPVGWWQWFRQPSVVLGTCCLLTAVVTTALLAERRGLVKGFGGFKGFSGGMCFFPRCFA